MIVTRTLFDTGGFADVLFDKEGRKAYKIFRGYHHPNADISGVNENQYSEYTRKVFNSEKDAYNLIGAHKLKKYFPVYYPEIVVEKVLTIDGSDISSQYLIDCCLVLELIEGDFRKWDKYENKILLEKHSFDLANVFNDLLGIGVKFTIDCSLALTSDGIKMIDVATTDFSDFSIE